MGTMEKSVDLFSDVCHSTVPVWRRCAEMVDYLGHADVMLIDFAVSGMNGAELARNVRARRPGLPILFVTEYADTSAFADIARTTSFEGCFSETRLETKLHAFVEKGLQTAAENVISLRLLQGQ
jgi:CheY-like chemotaxis protein